jgi:hypothetical protein
MDQPKATTRPAGYTALLDRYAIRAMPTGIGPSFLRVVPDEPIHQRARS